MKKVSFSLAAILAVVIAIGSAFTTDSKRVITEGWYLAASGTSLGTPPANPPYYNYSAAAFPVRHGLASPVVAIGQCASIPTQLCAAYFNASEVNVKDTDENIYFKAGGRQ